MTDTSALFKPHHGFDTPTSVDHRAWLWVTGLLGLAYSALALCARVTSKWGLFWYDDAILTVSYVFAWVHYGCLYKSFFDGLGAATSPENDKSYNAARYFFVSRIFLITALCLAKLSVISFARRIFTGSMYGEKYIFGISFTITAGWGVVAVLASSVDCHPTQSLVAFENAMCSANLLRWKLITAFDVLTEIILLALPVWLVSRNRISASNRRIVAFVFSFRLIVAASSVATMSTYSNFLQSGTARDSIGLAPVVISSEVMLCASLITASIPSLKSFMWAFMSRGVFAMYGVNTTASQGNSHGVSIPMQALDQGSSQSKSNNCIVVQQQQQRWEEHGLRPEGMNYHINIRASNQHDEDDRSMDSDGSERMIIRRQIDFSMHEG